MAFAHLGSSPRPPRPPPSPQRLPSPPRPPETSLRSLEDEVSDGSRARAARPRSQGRRARARGEAQRKRPPGEARVPYRLAPSSAPAGEARPYFIVCFAQRIASPSVLPSFAACERRRGVCAPTPTPKGLTKAPKPRSACLIGAEIGRPRRRARGARQVPRRLGMSEARRRGRLAAPLRSADARGTCLHLSCSLRGHARLSADPCSLQGLDLLPRVLAQVRDASLAPPAAERRVVTTTDSSSNK